VIGTLAVDGWAVTIGTTRRSLSGLGPHPVPILAVPNVKAHPSTATYVKLDSYSDLYSDGKPRVL